MRTLCLLMCTSVISAPVAAQTNQPSPPPVGVTAVGDSAKQNKMICQKMEVTGSRLGTRNVCHTAAEWTEIRAIERRDLERMQSTRTKSD